MPYYSYAAQISEVANVACDTQSNRFIVDVRNKVSTLRQTL